MIQHTAILVGSENFNEEVAKFDLNTSSANYRMTLDPRMVGYYYVISAEEDGYICFTTFRKEDELDSYEAGTISIRK